jgi:hypothetical protein
MSVEEVAESLAIGREIVKMESSLAQLQADVEALRLGDWIEKAAREIVRTMRYAVSNAHERDPERRGDTGYSDVEEIAGIEGIIRAALSENLRGASR